MQHKSILIPVIALLAVGAVWASSSLFPSPTGFPANPATPGTLGYVLAFFGIDGKAPDSAALAGRSATGYLQGNNCTAPGEVWRGIDTSGKAVCGLRSTPLAIGKFCQQTPTWVTVLRGGSSPWVAANMTDKLESGDIIQTNWGTATVCFDADDSILRLDTGTVVALETGNLGGNNVAQAILSNGRLWWRVLTSTGINIGGGGLIAGVRGTSVSVEKSASNYTLSIIDSQRSTDAAYIQNTIQAWVTPIPTSAGRQFIYISGSTSTPALASLNKATLMTQSVWIRENMKKDIDYLSTTTESPIVAWEYTITKPQGILESDAICLTPNGDDGWRWWSPDVWCKDRNIVAFADYTKWTTDMTLGYGGTLSQTPVKSACYGIDGGQFATIGNNTFLSQSNDTHSSCWSEIQATCSTDTILVSHNERCQLSTILDNGNTYVPALVWVSPERIPVNGWATDCVVYDQFNANTAARTIPHGQLDTYKGGVELTLSCGSPGTQSIQNIGTPLTAIPSTGVSITGGNHLSYDINSLPPLAGKTITIELDSPITNTNAVLLLLDSLPTGTANPAFYINSTGEPICITQSTSWCSASRVGSTYTLYLGNIVATRFEVGNSLLRNKPISRMIKKITIK